MTRHSWIRISALTALVAAGALRCGDSNQPPTATTIEMAGGDGQSGTVGRAVGQPAGRPGHGRQREPGGRRQRRLGRARRRERLGRDDRDGVRRPHLGGPGARLPARRADHDGLGKWPPRVPRHFRGDRLRRLDADARDEDPACECRTERGSARDATRGAAPGRGGNDQAQSGVEVTASLVGTTGTLGGTLTRTTDGTGAAAFTDLAITGPAGSYTLRFTAPGTLPVSSSAIAIAGGAATIAITTNPPVSALSGEVFDPVAQPAVQVTDAGGNPAAGVQVTASKASGSGTLEGSTNATTDAAGVARFGDLGISGSGSHTLQFTAGAAGVTSSPVTISPLPPEATTGKWGPVVHWDIVPLHMNLLPNGKILAWGKRKPPRPLPTPWACRASGILPPAPRVAFHRSRWTACSSVPATTSCRTAASWLPAATSRTTTGSRSPTSFPRMASGKPVPAWRTPGGTRPSPRCLTGACLRWAGGTRTTNLVTTPEICENGQWVELTGAGTCNIPYYPRNFVAPDGRIFYAGERISSRWFNVSGSGSWSDRPVRTTSGSSIGTTERP